MPRKKSDTPATGVRPRQERPPFAARYIRVCLTAMYGMILEHNEAGAAQAKHDVEEYVTVAFRGEAATAIMAAIDWVWELAHNFASQPVDVPIGMWDDSPAARAADGGSVIDHE